MRYDGRVSLRFRRFFRYSLVGGSTFLLDLALLFLLIDCLQIDYLRAAGVAFLVAVSINYVVSRTFVFPGTTRTLKQGYFNFIGIALLGLGLVVGGMFVVVEKLGVSYLVARILIAAVTGFWNYLMNLFVNFKVVGLHLK